jgi:alpha-mannosidase
MNDDSPNPETAETEATSSVETRQGPKLFVFVDGVESDPKYVVDGPAAISIFEAWRLAWHPAVLCRAGKLPRMKTSPHDPQSPESGAFYVVPGRLLDKLPTSFLTQAEDLGASVIVASDDASASLDEFFRRLRRNDISEPFEGRSDLVADFQALGIARLWLHACTIALGHVDVVNHDDLANETFAAADRWVEGDFGSATNHLRAAFEVLLRARERFYPVDSWLLDLVLMHRTVDLDAIRETLADESTKTLMGAADFLARLADEAPDVIDSIRAGVDAGRLDVAGGPFSEHPDHLLPLETVRTSYRQGDAVYRQHLDDRSVETLFHRHFALSPDLPHMARRLGFRFGLPMAFDGGTFPIRRESKMLWASPDGTTLEALTRVPADTDDTLLHLRFPWMLGQSMRDDHVALAVWLGWPGKPPMWLETLRKIQSYAPVFGRMITAGDFFAQTDRPFDTMTPDVDAFIDHTLENALTKDEADPVSRLTSDFEARGVYDALSWIHSLARSLDVVIPNALKVDALLANESTDVNALREAAELSRELAASIAPVILEDAPTGTPGSLIFNPCAVARRVPLVLDSAAPDLRLCDSVKSAQFLAEGTLVVADLPANGFAWVPHFANTDDPLTPMGQLKFDFENHEIVHPSFVVALDARTGGFKGMKRPGEPRARLGQQLAVVGASGEDSVVMIAEGEPDVAYGGPARLEVRTRGRVVDPADESRTVARFEQVYTAHLGRPTLELKIELSEVDDSFFSSTHAAYSARGRALVSRWAWRESSARMRRLTHLQAHPTTAKYPTTSEAIELSHENKRVTIVPLGLPYHQRHGERMLDTVLITGRESKRSFEIDLVLDLEFAHQAVVDRLTPAIVIPVRTGPPKTGHQGWFYHIDHRNVAMTKLEYHPAGTEGRGPALVFHLHETAGRAARTRLRLMTSPGFAKQIDDRGQTILDLTVTEDAVDIDLTPWEIARIEIGL